jgi:hypothetical protein
MEDASAGVRLDRDDPVVIITSHQSYFSGYIDTILAHSGIR